jgi:hypothetical protein
MPGMPDEGHSHSIASSATVAVMWLLAEDVVEVVIRGNPKFSGTLVIEVIRLRST